MTIGGIALLIAVANSINASAAEYYAGIEFYKYEW
jgi:hypothetical protein